MNSNWWLNTLGLVALCQGLSWLARQRDVPPQGANEAAAPPAHGPDQTEPLRQYLLGWAERYSDYHNHKEAMVYTAIALYVAAGAWVITSDDLFEDAIRTLPRQIGFLLFTVIAAFSGWRFIRWQLLRRRAAAVLEEAGWNAGALLLGPVGRDAHTLSTAPHVEAVDDTVQLPTLLRQEINRLEHAPDLHLRRGEGWARFIVGLFGCGAAARVVAEIVSNIWQ